jgi:hypothetical protein
LAKEGAKREPDRAKNKEMPRHQKKWAPSFEGAAGVVCSTTDNRWFEPTTPSAPAKEAARHFVDGRSHPSLAKEGSLARPKISSEKQKMTICYINGYGNGYGIAATD